MKQLLILAAATCSVLWGGPGTCLSLASGQTVHGSTSFQHPACFVATVKAGEANRVLIDQPVDLLLRVSYGGESMVVDGFEFGTETFTILPAGDYRIDVQPVEASSGHTVIFSMSRLMVPLQTAQSWRDAELSATVSKRTNKHEDVSKSLLLWKEVNDYSAIGRTYLKEGNALYAGGDIAGARTVFEKALQTCGSIPEPRCTAEAANNSGYASFLMGDLDAASLRLRDAATQLRRLSLDLLEARALNNLGMMFRQSGDFEQAIDTLDEARRIVRGRDAIVHAQVLNNLGLCYQALSENEKALAYFQSALTIFVEQHEHTVRVRTNIGISYMFLGRLDRAKATLEAALDESKRTSNTPARADALNILGQVLLNLHRGDEARACLTEALALQRLAHSKRGEARALHYLGVDASQRAETESARQSFIQAMNIRSESGLRDEASASAFALAELEYRAGNVAAASRWAGQAIDLIELLRTKAPSAALRASYYADKRRYFDLLTEIAMDPANRGDSSQGLIASERARGRALLDLITAGGINVAIPRELLNRRIDLRRHVAVLALRLSEPSPQSRSDSARQSAEQKREDLRRQIQLLLSEDQQVDAEIRRAVNASALGQPLSSIAELQAALSPDCALLEYYLGERATYLWIVRRDGIQSFRLPGRAAIIPLASRTASRFGAILDRRRSPQEQSAFESDLRRLSYILLGPLARVHLPSKVILVLDGVLNRVPFAALRPPGFREALGLSFNLIRAPSAAYLLAAKVPRPISTFPQSILVVSDPVFGTGDARLTVPLKSPALQSTLPRLPFAQELSVISSLVPPRRMRVLKGFDASPANLRALDLREFAVLHFSTHAFIDDQIPELSRVVLSLVDRAGRPVDGYMHPYQFTELRLDGAIVVLSSCDTALGKEVLGEGLMGFSDSLFSAGAAQLVLTLTRVDAESSAAFFAETYRHLFAAHPTSMENSLTLARRALARSTRWSDPYYWAAFTVVGSPSGIR